MTQMKSQPFDFKPYITKGMDYATYIALVKELVSEGKTSGPNQQQDLVDYTKLNLQRMERIYKTTTVSPELNTALKKITSPQTWVVITEAWCGDAAQNIPLLAMLADIHPYIQLKLVLRDENLDLIDQFLTNGGRAIPILLVLNEQQELLHKWGPRPQLAQDLVIAYKQHPNMTFDEFKVQLQVWYNKDKTHAQQQEFIDWLHTL
jgi:hypothetical protein